MTRQNKATIFVYIQNNNPWTVDVMLHSSSRTIPKLLHVPLIRNVQHKTLDCDIYQGAETVHPRFPPGTVDSSFLIGPIPAQGENGAMGLYLFIETVE